MMRFKYPICLFVWLIATGVNAAGTVGETNKQTVRREDVQADIQTQKGFYELPPIPPLPTDVGSTAPASQSIANKAVADLKQHKDNPTETHIGTPAALVATDVVLEGVPNKLSEKEVGQVEQSPNQQLLIQSD